MSEVSIVEEKVDLEVELAKVATERRDWEEAHRELKENISGFLDAEKGLHHKLATNLVAGLLDELVQLSALFTEGAVFGAYTGIQAHIDKIRVHDPDFPKSLSKGVYEVESEHFDFWLGHLEKHLAAGVSLDKFLTAVFSKVHGGPFERK